MSLRAVMRYVIYVFFIVVSVLAVISSIENQHPLHFIVTLLLVFFGTRPTHSSKKKIDLPTTVFGVLSATLHCISAFFTGRYPHYFNIWHLIYAVAFACLVLYGSSEKGKAQILLTTFLGALSAVLFCILALTGKSLAYLFSALVFAAIALRDARK